MTLSSLFRSAGTLLIVSLAMVSAKAGVITTATATHSVTIDSVTGAGALDLSIEAELLDLFTDAFGDGATDATASVTAGGSSLDFSTPIAPLIVGDTVEATASAIAESLAAGFSLSVAGTEVDIIFDLPSTAAGPAEIVMTYGASVAAGVSGSDFFAFGFASSETIFSDFFFADVLLEVEWDSDFDGGDGSGIPVSVGFDAPGTFTFTLDPGEQAFFIFDANAIAVSAIDVVPEPTSCAVWLGLGLVSAGVRRRRRSHNG